MYMSFIRTLDEIERNFDKILKDYHFPFNGARYLTDKEVSVILKISRRTLQEYRNEGRIAYYMIGGKILYKESDIEKMLNDNYFCPTVE